MVGDGEGLRVQGYFRAVGRRKAKERRAAFERHNAALQRLSLDVSSDIAQAWQSIITALYQEGRKKHTFRSKLPLQALEEDTFLDCLDRHLGDGQMRWS